jgi:ElaB/YqjD/DUF883 family membrane-anchored ribosome-binding protein
MAQGTESIRQDIDVIRDSMTDTMGQIESHVKGTVDTTVANVKRTFDVKQQIANQPWAALGIAIVAGYVLGSLDGNSGTSDSSRDADNRDQSTQAHTASMPHKPGIVDDVMDQFGDELNVLKSAAVAMAVTMLRDTIQQNVPQLAKAYQRAQQAPAPTPSPRPAPPTAVGSAYRENGHSPVQVGDLL